MKKDESSSAAWLADTLKPQHQLVQVEQHIYSTSRFQAHPRSYGGRMSTFYDTVVGSCLYNRIAWGNHPRDYEDFARFAVSDHEGGRILDVGCGSLRFTHRAYRKAAFDRLVLLDGSIYMLRKARKRIQRQWGAVPPAILLLLGDALDLPFLDATFDLAVSFGLMHLFEDGQAFLSELNRVIGEDGAGAVTGLVNDRRFGRFYLSKLLRWGEVGAVRSGSDMARCIESLSSAPHCRVRGNMAYCSWTKG